MDISLVVSIISMIATVGSFIIAMKATSDVKVLEQKITNIENSFNNKVNKHDVNNVNTGTNSGVMTGNVTGGVSIGK
ncbi:hypothetical protein UT300009_21260 [Paraclostridium bifermentans]